MDEIRWTKLALQDFDAIAAYIAADNPRAAQITVERIVAAAARLSRFPRAGRNGRIPDTRELIVGGLPYIVAYRLTPDIEILSILHTSRNWPESL